MTADEIKAAVNRMAKRRNDPDTPERRLQAAIDGLCFWCKLNPYRVRRVDHEDHDVFVCILCEDEVDAIGYFLEANDV